MDYHQEYFKIIEKKQLSADVFYFKVNAPEIARNRKAGQFVLVQIDVDYGERIPLTIADANVEEGWLVLVFQAVGATTLKLSRKNEGDEIAAILGPLGNPTHIEKKGTVICVGGGIGVAPLHPIVQAHKAAGNKVIVIMGARNKDLLIFEDEMRALADELYIMTDDGSYGNGVPWNGLTGVTESPSGGEATPLYADNIKYLNLMSAEEFGATIEAYTYPDEFAECDGSAELTEGVYIGQQSRKEFGLSYVTTLGNDTEKENFVVFK